MHYYIDCTINASLKTKERSKINSDLVKTPFRNADQS